MCASLHHQNALPAGFAPEQCSVHSFMQHWAKGSQMERVIQAALIVAGLIHFLPIAGVIGAHQLASMYALPFDERNLAILMRHRAVMLGLLGGFVLCAAFRPALRVPAIFLGTVSLASLVSLAWSTGGYNRALSAVVFADTIAVVCFLIAAALHVVARRRS